MVGARRMANILSTLRRNCARYKDGVRTTTEFSKMSSNKFRGKGESLEEKMLPIYSCRWANTLISCGNPDFGKDSFASKLWYVCNE